MEFRFIITYFGLFVLGICQVYAAYILQRKNRSSFLVTFFYMVIIDVLMGILEIVFRFFLPYAIKTDKGQLQSINMIFGLIIVPLMIIFLYIFVEFMINLNKESLTPGFKKAYWIYWGLFFIGFILAEKAYFVDGSFALTEKLESIFNFSIIVIGLGACFYNIIKKPDDTDSSYYRMTRMIIYYYVLMFIIGISFFTSILPGFLNRLYSYIYILIYNIPPLVLFYLSQKHYDQNEPLEFQDFAEQLLNKKGISRREKDIIQLIIDGHSNKEIQDKLYISIRTVESHIYRIYQKLGIKNRIQLINLLKEDKKNSR
ncbi:MAG: hypothetical protein JW737_05330 [Acidobacteria bacterium]|nr:hypothetical protein [Acidobacteriota bacterium]